MTTTIENKIAKSSEEQKLPALTGSVKQIAWATDIRAKKLASLNDMAGRNQSNVNDAQRRKNEIACQAARNVLLTKVDSRFWIDNRFTETKKLFVVNNLQDDLKAEFERLCNEAEVKAEVKAEEKPAEVNAETDGSEDDPDDQKDVFNLLPAIETLNDVDTTQTNDEIKAAADQMGLMQLNRKIADLEEQLIDNRLAATAVLDEITDDTTFAEQKDIERRYSKHAAISDALIDEKAIYAAAKSTRLSQIAAIKNLMRKNETPTVAQVKTADAQPQDNFTTELAKLKAAADEANAEDRKARDAEVEAYNTWQAAKQKVDETSEKYRAAIVAYKSFGENKAKAMRDRLLTDDIIRAKGITIINQQGEVTKETISQIWISFWEDKFKISASWDKYGTYDTPAQVETVINMLKSAIERGDEEFTFPTVDELNTPPEMPPCAPKSPDITQANKNEHKPEKSVSNPLEYWVSNDYGNFAKRKKLTHPRGKKFYFVDWDKTNYRNYWLTYTRDEDEDKLLLGDQQHIWVKIPRSDAVDLVKRGGQRTSVTPSWFVDCAAWFFDWSDMPIFPYVVKVDSKTVNPKNIYINKKSHTVEEC